jgi:hypothetical protein
MALVQVAWRAIGPVFVSRLIGGLAEFLIMSFFRWSKTRSGCLFVAILLLVLWLLVGALLSLVAAQPRGWVL